MEDLLHYDLPRIPRVDHVRFRPHRRYVDAESSGPRCRELDCHVQVHRAGCVIPISVSNNKGRGVIK